MKFNINTTYHGSKDVDVKGYVEIEAGKPKQFYLFNINNKLWKDGIFFCTDTSPNTGYMMKSNYFGYCQKYLQGFGCTCKENNSICSGWNARHNGFKLVVKVTKKAKLLYGKNF